MSISPLSSSPGPEYVWELATLYPEQGEWSEEEYLLETDGANRRIEFADGRLEFLPMPTEVHQELIAFLYRVLFAYVEQRDLGKVHFSGIRLRIRPRKIREPDIIFLRNSNYYLRHKRVWDGADLVMEVVSESPMDRDRDYETKRLDYAEAKVSEYWIVDPEARVVIVHELDGDRYIVHGQFAPGERATSALLPDFSVDVAALFAVMDEIPD